jgi:putative membrane protein
MTPYPNPFPTPTRQSAVAIVFILGNTFRLLLRQLWVFLLVVFFNPKRRTFDGFTLFFIGVAGFGAIMSIINYFNYYFYIEEGELRLEKGVLRKVKVTVPLDRIQTVNFKQNIVHQAFNVVAVEIDTAGSAGDEFSLHAIRKEQADALRDFVENYRRMVAAEPVALGKETQAPVALPAVSPKQETLLFNLSPLDLLKIGFSQNHLRTAGIIMAFFFGFFDDLEEAFGFDLSKKIEEWLGLALHNATYLYYFLVGIPFFLLASFLVSLVNTVLRFFDLRFFRTERGFKMISGLFTRHEVSANLQKIQYLRWSSSPVKRYFGMYSLRLNQAASTEISAKQAVAVPGCYEPGLEAARQAYFPTESSLVFEEHGVDKRLIRRQFIVWGIFPTAIALQVFHHWMGSGAFFSLLWLPFAWRLCVSYHQRWRWYVSEEGIRTSWGVFNRHTALLQWHKVQAMTIRQGYFMRGSRLANLTLYTAAGALNVPYIPLEKAQSVQDFVLYKVESDQRKWM